MKMVDYMDSYENKKISSVWDTVHRRKFFSKLKLKLLRENISLSKIYSWRESGSPLEPFEEKIWTNKVWWHYLFKLCNTGVMKEEVALKSTLIRSVLSKSTSVFGFPSVGLKFTLLLQCSIFCYFDISRRWWSHLYKKISDVIQVQIGDVNVEEWGPVVLLVWEGADTALREPVAPLVIVATQKNTVHTENKPRSLVE